MSRVLKYMCQKCRRTLQDTVISSTHLNQYLCFHFADTEADTVNNLSGWSVYLWNGKNLGEINRVNGFSPVLKKPSYPHFCSNFVFLTEKKTSHHLSVKKIQQPPVFRSEKSIFLLYSGPEKSLAT